MQESGGQYATLKAKSGQNPASPDPGFQQPHHCYFWPGTTEARRFNAIGPSIGPLQLWVAANFLVDRHVFEGSLSDFFFLLSLPHSFSFSADPPTDQAHDYYEPKTFPTISHPERLTYTNTLT